MYNLKFVITAATSLMATATMQARHKSTQERPNIVIIYADDMGYGDMSCQNPSSKIKTPNIDKLASEGMRFTDGHSSCTVSSPSRYALLTGNYHWRRMVNIVGPYGDSEFVEAEMTMPRMLKECGYRTAMVGKWHLGWDWSSVLTAQARQRFASVDSRLEVPQYELEDFDWSGPFEGGPVSIGFDYYYGDGTINFPPYCWIENDRVVTPPTFWVSDLNFKPMEAGGSLRKGPAAVDWHPSKVLPTIVEKGVEVIMQQDGETPFFLYLSLSAPHAPIIPSEEFRGKSDAGYYGDFVIQCDDIVARVEQALRAKGLEDNTIVIFTSDNGAETFAFDRIEKFDHNSTQSLRGIKRDMWEGGHRVPFIVKWPKKIDAGAISQEAVSQVDFMQTFADILGYRLPSEAAADSYSLTPVLLAERYEKPLREAMVYNFKEHYALRQGDWVLINGHTGSVSKAPQSYLDRGGYVEYQPGDADYLLYNVVEDQLQHNNLADKYPERVEQMKNTLKRYMESGRSVEERIK